MEFNNFTFQDNYLGFKENKELLTNNFDKFNCKTKHRRLFLNLSNYVLKSICQFSKYEQKTLSKYNLKKAFEYKISTLLPSNIFIHKKAKKDFNFCEKSTKIINNYNNNENKTFLFSNSKLLPAAKLINFCYTNNTMQVFIDKHLLFHEFVLSKIRKLHKDKDVIDLGDSISIKAKNICSLKIYTSWKNIDRKNLNIKDELKDAIKSIKNGEYNQVYLAYPKDDSFTRHIPVYVEELKNKPYQIKAIPYSFRSIIRN